MRVLVVGSGAREHTLVWKLQLSEQVQQVYCAPGNAGTAGLGANVPIAAEQIDELARWAREHGIDLTIVGPEGPLVAGLVDRFQAAGLRAFGPTAAAAEIEGSKVWAKELCLRHGIPTAQAAVATTVAEARRAVDRFGLPAVVKADGLAAGKGVTVAHTREEAEAAIDSCLVRAVFGAAGARVLIEECLVGREVSLIGIADGETVLPLLPACDYKRALDGDEGPNTGGMGAYCPSVFVAPEDVRALTELILQPTVRAMAAEGRPYRGFLYAGLMLTTEGPRVLEFNCRLGDPEAQVILPLLRTDFGHLVMEAMAGRLDRLRLDWQPGACVGVVLVSGGYPGNYQVGQPIEGLDDVPEGVLVFHAGTTLQTAASRGLSGLAESLGLRSGGMQVITSGGRVLTVVATGSTLAEARERAYAAAPRIRFRGRYYRSDIARERPVPVRYPMTPPPGPAPAPDQGASAPAPESESTLLLPDHPLASPTTGDANAPGAHEGAAGEGQPVGAGDAPALESAAEAAMQATARAVVSVVAGSERERPLMAAAAQALAELGIPHEQLVLSAHHDPARLQLFASTARQRGIRVIIAGAGLAGHLPGFIAAWTTVPVIAVPSGAGELRGLDALYAVAQMPCGVPVATTGIGEDGARNAAYFAAAMIGLADPEVQQRYERFRASGGQR